MEAPPARVMSSPLGSMDLQNLASKCATSDFAPQRQQTAALAQISSKTPHYDTRSNNSNDDGDGGRFSSMRKLAQGVSQQGTGSVRGQGARDGAVLGEFLRLVTVAVRQGSIGIDDARVSDIGHLTSGI